MDEFFSLNVNTKGWVQFGALGGAEAYGQEHMQEEIK
jgi:hypothetical protein